MEDVVIFQDADEEYLRVATTIEEFVAGTGGKWDWDDFTSIISSDPYLEHIQSECILVHDRYYAGSFGYCTEEGFQVLLALAREVREKVGVWPKLDTNGKAGQ